MKIKSGEVFCSMPGVLIIDSAGSEAGLTRREARALYVALGALLPKWEQEAFDGPVTEPLFPGGLK